MKIIFLCMSFVFLLQPLFSQTNRIITNNNETILYCKMFDSKKLLTQLDSYDQCFPPDKITGTSYYKIFLQRNRVNKVEFYNQEEILLKTETYSYKENNIRKRIGSVYQSGNTKYLTYTFYRGRTVSNDEGETHLSYTKDRDGYVFNRTVDMKIDPFTYFKRVEKYKNKLLVNESYYDRNDRLHFKIFYSKQKLSGYKIRQYKKGRLIKEQYVEKSSRWVHKYDQFERKKITYHYPPDKKGFIFSIYFYNRSSKEDPLLVKEDYYINNKLLTKMLVKINRPIRRANRRIRKVNNQIIKTKRQIGWAKRKKRYQKKFKRKLSYKLNRLLVRLYGLKRFVRNRIYYKKILQSIKTGEPISFRKKPTLAKQRETWQKEFIYLRGLVLNEIEGEKNFRRKTFWYFRRRQDVVIQRRTGRPRAGKSENHKNSVSFKKLAFFDDKIEKIEYYRADRGNEKEKVSNYGQTGDLVKTDRYNRKGEKIFEEE